jgi:hypothetical protein
MRKWDMPFGSEKSRTMCTRSVSGKKEVFCAAFHTATPPVAWRHSFDEEKDIVISLKEQNSEWDLGFTSEGGEFRQIAHFDEKHLAKEAFGCIQKRLMAPYHGPLWSYFWRLALLAACVVGLLAMWGAFVGPSEPEITATEKTNEAPAAQEQKQIIPGVPLKADDVVVPPEDY